ncbi:hypothetical protein KRZ98_17425 [Sphingobium sp. AS12]|uniref:hypothetical protein n=1 Tax=Sphingobium sp. AS12 TaxID=2849495 RepID=UPI001C314B5D|nr:hypothetical protein [Sphingobium sp. AS12]MBV2150026.1 hypothetical protein [Sphingobium sp. AS12]
MIIKMGAITVVSAVGLSFFTFQSGPGFLPAGALNAEDRSAPATPAPVTRGIIPGRHLDCTLGRIANFDPNRVQEASEYVFEGRHKFGLFLPTTPVRTAPPPDPVDAPEPVDPQTRIVVDPDGLARDSEGRPFNRVVDLWPERVEMTKPINDVAVTLLIVDGIDQARSTATVFLTKANDAATFDLKNLYYGQCGVTVSAPGKTPPP